MTTHELARKLLEQPDKEMHISVDVSTCCNDAGNRIHTDGGDCRLEFVHIEDGPPGHGNVSEVIMCVDGRANFRYIGELEAPICECKDCEKKLNSNWKLARRWGYMCP